MTNLMQMLLVLLLQSTVLLLLGLLALHFTQKRGPTVQSLVGRAALAGVALLALLLPLTGHIQPVIRVPEPAPRYKVMPQGIQVAPLLNREGEEIKAKEIRMRPVGAPLAAPFDRAGDVPAPAARVLPPDPDPAFQPAAPTEIPRRPAPGGQLLVTGGFVSVSFLLFLWLGVCQGHLTRLRRTAQAVTTGPALDLLAALTSSPPLLLTHPSVQSPFLAGYRRPAIFLPDTYAADFDADALRAIFVHELAHRDRRDNLWTLAARLLSALLWPQPLLWLLARKLEHLSEDACDQAVLAAQCPPRAYADCLLFLAARPPLTPRQRTLNAGVAPFRSSIGRRISRILALQGVRPMSPITLRLRLSIAALTVAAALSGAFLVSSAPAQTQPKPALVETPELLKLHTEQRQDLQNLKVIGLALTMYERDNHYRLPDADHWMDQVTPYLNQIADYRQNRSVFYDPFQSGQKRYGYAFNRNCSRQSLAAFSSPSETVAVFDSTLETRNASDIGASLRINPAIDISPDVRVSPANSDYVFVDGHAKFFMSNLHPSFSLAGGMPSIDGNDHDILGAWISSNFGAAKTALIFSFANSVEKVSPWPGDTRKLVHFYGRYNAHPTDLKYIFTRVWVEGKPMYTIAPEKHLVDYALSEDGQTITLKDKSDIVYRRSPTYMMDANRKVFFGIEKTTVQVK